MNLEDVQKILSIIDDSHFTEISLQIGDAHLVARKGTDGTTTSTTVHAPNGTVGTDPADGVGPAPAASPGAAASGAAGAHSPAAGTPPATVPADADAEDGILVRAPMLGVFYRAPAPGEPSFAAEGQRVEAGDTIGSIEVMKLFNSIKAGVPGTVVRFLAENGELVEFDQPLVLVRPEQP